MARSGSQADEQVAGLATRYIEEQLDGPDARVGWDEVRAQLQTRHGKTAEQAGAGLLLAVLDLEWSGAIQYDRDRLRRPGLPADAVAADLPVVADAVMGLGWPRPVDGRRSRTIHQCFLELEGRFRHCDVYWAMHEVLKGQRLACHRAHWSKLGDGAVLADDSLPAADRVELERAFEADLCDRYVAWLRRGRDPVVGLVREYRLPAGAPGRGASGRGASGRGASGAGAGVGGDRRADIFDRGRRLIVEAKAYTDDVVALGAVTQAMLYRTLANEDADVVDRVAVLLPGPPSELARRVARIHELDVDVIWPDGDEFRHEPFA